MLARSTWKAPGVFLRSRGYAAKPLVPDFSHAVSFGEVGVG